MDLYTIEVCIDLVIMILCCFRIMNPLPGALVYFFFESLSYFIKIPLQYTEMVWNNKRFKSTYVTAEVLYHDELRGNRTVVKTTVINYVMNGKSIDVLLYGTIREPGEKIEIITDGEFASLAKPNRRDIFNNVKHMITTCIVSGILFFAFLKYINVYIIMVFILWSICKIVIWPYVWRDMIKGLKEWSGWHENV